MTQLTMQLRWFQKASLTTFVGGGRIQPYEIQKDLQGNLLRNGIPVLQQAWVDLDTGEYLWEDVKIVFESDKEAEMRCAVLNAKVKPPQADPAENCPQCGAQRPPFDIASDGTCLRCGAKFHEERLA